MWERYFGSTQAIIDSVLAVVRTRLGIPAIPAADEPSPSVFNDSFVVSFCNFQGIYFYYF